MKIASFLNKLLYGVSNVKRIYIYRGSNLVEWFELENIRDRCYLGWGDKRINSFAVMTDSIAIYID